jgi:WD40 repeat protein
MSSASFSPDGTSLWTWIGHGWYVTSLSTGDQDTLNGRVSFNPQAVSKDGRWAICYYDGERGAYTELVQGYEWVEGDWVERWRCELGHEWRREGYGQLRGFSADGRRFLCASGNSYRHFDGGRIAVFDSASGRRLHRWSGRVVFGGSPLSLSPSDILACVDGQLLHLIDLTQNGVHVTRTNTSRKHFTAAAFSPDGKLLATTSNDTTVTMWDTATWEPIRQYAWEVGRLRAVAFAPDGLTCAAGSDTGKVVLFDVDG